MKRFLERSLLFSRSGLFLVNLLTLVGVGLTVYYTIHQLASTIQQQIQTQQTLETLQRTLTLLTDAETGQRGYIFTRQERFLDPYYDAIAILDPTLDELQTHLNAAPDQQAAFRQLQSLIQQRLALMQNSIKLQRQRIDLSTQIKISDRGKAIHDQIRRTIAEMQEREQQRLQQLSTESQSLSRLTSLSLLGGMGLSLGLFTLTYRLLNRQIKAYQLAETALATSEEKLRLALEAARIGIWDWNMQTGVITWSKEHATLFGLTFEEFDGRYETFDARLHPDDRQGLNQAVTQALNDHISYHHEYRVIWPDSSIHWIEGRGHVFYDETGQPYRMSGTVMDIDDRKQAEAALRLSEQRYASLAAAAPVGIFRTTAEGECIYVNERWCEIAGLSVAEALGGGWVRALHPDDRERVDAAWYEAAQNQTLFRLEYRFQRPDGSTSWVFGQAVAEWSSDGQTMGYVGTITDISDRKQAEIALQTLNAELEQRVAQRTIELHHINQALLQEIEVRQQTEADLQQTIAEVTDLYNNAPCGYHTVDVDGFFVRINDTELRWLGYSREELLHQKKCTEILTSESARKYKSNSALFQQQGYVNDQEYQAVRKDGSLVDISINAVAIRDETGEITMSRVMVTDISDRKRNEAEQQRIARMKDEFVSVVSHELRTPLTAVYGALNLLVENTISANSEQGQRVIQIAADNAKRLVNLVNDILDLERLASGKISLNKQPCSVATLLTSAVNLNQLLANRAGITLQISADEIEVMVDRDRILQVLTNLLSNAIKFSPGGSVVWLRAEVGIGVLFSVTDQGRGIPADKLESIFERFQQADASDARQHHGTGLGLAICRSIVQQHGGQIWAESTVGEGSRFCFTVPMAAE